MKPEERTLLDKMLAEMAQTQPEPAPAALYSGYHKAAAVLTRYDVGAIQPFGDDVEEEEALPALLADSDHVKIDDRSWWTLHDDIRREVLLEMGDADTLRQALAANSPHPTDVAQTLLEAYVAGTAPPVDQLERSQLTAAIWLIEWLAGIVDNLPSRESISQRFEQLDLLSPFQHLVGEHFRGRKQELGRLRSFVGLGEEPGEGERRAPIVLHALGGMGKSTLIAKFILEIAEEQGPGRFPWSYLDMDRPGLRPEQPLTLLIESLRQLGIQYPESRSRCDQIREDWQRILGKRSRRQSMQKASEGQQAAQIDRYRWPKELYNYVTLVRSLKPATAPLLLVLDTFEEVQYRSPLVVDNVLNLVHALQDELPTARLIISGRAALDEGQMDGMDELALGNFDDSAALGYLEGRGVPTKVARFIITRIDLSPLSLSLAFDLWDGSDKAADPESLFGDLAIDLDHSQRQGVMFGRILRHIHDRNLEVHKIAYPGLILRRITPEIIEKVLAEPCGLGRITSDKAQELYVELRREVGLVIDEGDALRHRPDLRRVMVSLLRGGAKQRVRRIEEAAITYYAQQTLPSAKAEEIYHRLSLKQPFSQLDAAWGSDSHVELRTLYGAVEELEPRQRAWLIGKLPDRSLTEEESRAARRTEWEDDTAVKVRQLLTTRRPGDVKRALQLLDQRKERQANSELYALEAQAYNALGNFPAAEKVLQKGIRAAARWQHYALAIDLRIMQAQMARAAGEVEVAQRALGIADRQVRRLDGSRLQMIEIGLEQPDISLESHPERARELSGWFFELDDEDIVANGPLIGRLVGEIGCDDPAVLWRVIDLTGIDSEHRDRLHALGRAIAEWDADYSAAHRAAPGVLLRQFEIPETGPLPTSWAAHLLEVSPAERANLVRNLRDIGDRLPRPVRTELAALMAGRDVTLTPAEVPEETRGSEFKLSGGQFEDLVKALADAFTSYAELSRMLRFRLDINLEAISPHGSLNEVLFRLIEAAQAEGWLEAFIVAAREARPNNTHLAVVAAELMGDSGQFQGVLETVLGTNTTLSVEAFRAQLPRLSTRFCRIEVRSQPVATGVLIASDLVLTNYHGLDELLEGKLPTDEVRARFDFTSTDQYGVSAGVSYSLAHNWDTAHSPTEELDFAIVRLNDAVGDIPLGSGSFESTAEVRGWVQLTPSLAALNAGDNLALIHYPREAQQQLSIGQFESYSADKTRIRYQINTEPGSTGGGVFDLNGTMIAWRRALPASSEGTTIDAILQWLEVRELRRLVDDSRRGAHSVTLTFGPEERSEPVNAREIGKFRINLGDARRAGDVVEQSAQLINIGASYRAAGQYEQAGDSLRAALKLARETGHAANEVQALVILAAMSQEAGQSHQAVEMLEEAHATAKTSGDWRLEATALDNLAHLHQATGDYIAAQEYYALALQERENGLEANDLDIIPSLNNLAGLLRVTGDYEGARHYFERALQIQESVLGQEHPDTAAGLNNLAVLLTTTGDYVAAQTTLDRAVERNPNLATTYYNRANNYFETEQYEAALSDYQHAMELDNSIVAAFVGRGTVFALLGRQEQAQVDFERAIELDPINVQAHLGFGALLENRGELSEALRHFERAAEMGSPEGAKRAREVRKKL